MSNANEICLQLPQRSDNFNDPSEMQSLINTKLAEVNNDTSIVAIDLADVQLASSSTIGSLLSLLNKTKEKKET